MKRTLTGGVVGRRQAEAEQHAEERAMHERRQKVRGPTPARHQHVCNALLVCPIAQQTQPQQTRLPGPCGQDAEHFCLFVRHGLKALASYYG